MFMYALGPLFDFSHDLLNLFRLIKLGYLTLTTPWADSADDNLIFFLFFPQELCFDIVYKSSLRRKFA